MKLRNKKTGEIGNLLPYGCEDGKMWVWIGNMSRPEYRYNSLAELNEDWEDYEEPKTFWAISWAGEPEEYDAKKTPQELKDMAKQIGNYFETKEEAEKAVEKLKAWKRLEDKGFKVDLWEYDGGNYQERMKTGRILFRVKDYEGVDEDLSHAFGDEE